MKARWYSLLFVMLLLVAIPVDASNSLWTDEAAKLYQDEEVKFELGDVVTVIIDEEATASQSADTSVNQESSVGAGPGVGIFEFVDTFSLNYEDEDSANGETNRSGMVEADITTVIKEIMPNGTLKIVGEKKVKINGEEQIIKISGIVRPDDISEDNTVSSTRVANATIEYEGEGVVTEKQRPNIFQRLLNWIF